MFQAESASHSLCIAEGDQKGPVLSDGAREWKWFDGDTGMKKSAINITLGYRSVNKRPNMPGVCKNAYFENHKQKLIVPWENIGDFHHGAIPFR